MAATPQVFCSFAPNCFKLQALFFKSCLFISQTHFGNLYLQSGYRVTRYEVNTGRRSSHCKRQSIFAAKNYKTAKQYSFHSQQTSSKEKAQVLKRFHKTSSLIKSKR